MTQQLIGTWTWVIQVNDGIYTGGYTGNPLGDTLTPGSTGIQETLTFDAGHEWIVTRNGQVAVTGMYKIDTLAIPMPAGATNPFLALDLMRPGEPDSVVNHVVYGDTLAISNMAIGSVGVVRVYVRPVGYPFLF